jgi:hypothetical protein
VNYEHRLQEAVDALHAQIRVQEEQLVTQIKAYNADGLAPGLTPSMILDSNNRPILLDARTAIVNGLAALVRSR